MTDPDENEIMENIRKMYQGNLDSYRPKVDPFDNDETRAKIAALQDVTIPAGTLQYGHKGQHHGTGEPECPKYLHHHHDERCTPPLPTLRSIIENHRACATATPDQMRDLREQIERLIGS